MCVLTWLAKQSFHFDLTIVIVTVSICNQHYGRQLTYIFLIWLCVFARLSVWCQEHPWLWIMISIFMLFVPWRSRWNCNPTRLLSRYLLCSPEEQLLLVFVCYMSTITHDWLEVHSSSCEGPSLEEMSHLEWSSFFNANSSNNENTPGGCSMVPRSFHPRFI